MKLKWKTHRNLYQVIEFAQSKQLTYSPGDFSEFQIIHEADGRFRLLRTDGFDYNLDRSFDTLDEAKRFAETLVK